MPMNKTQATQVRTLLLARRGLLPRTDEEASAAVDLDTATSQLLDLDPALDPRWVRYADRHEAAVAEAEEAALLAEVEALEAADEEDPA